MPAAPPRRIVVVGTTGSGKTTVALALGRILDLPVLELDAVHWGPGWTPRPDPEIRRRIEEVVAAEEWVVDGNYLRFQELVWGRAEAVVWLDLRFPVIFWRLIRRTVRRSVCREPLWAGNTETLRGAFASRDSILWWQITTFGRNRRRYRSCLADPRWAHLQIVRLRRPAEVGAFLESLQDASAG